MFFSLINDAALCLPVLADVPVFQQKNNIAEISYHLVAAPLQYRPRGSIYRVGGLKLLSETIPRRISKK